MHLTKNGQYRTSIKHSLLSFLIIPLLACGASAAAAGTIYQCKQANGKVAFQEVPCAQADTQAEVGKTIHAAPARATKSPAPAADSKTKPASMAEQEEPADAKYAACRPAGVQLFDPALEQHLQHPQAAFNGCKKALPAPLKRNGLCLDACVQGWAGEYTKRYVGKAP